VRRILVPLFLLLAIAIFPVDPGDVARQYFAEALIHWGKGEFTVAREALTKAMAGEVYLEDIPEFWYFLAKLDLEEGNVQKAREELNNVSLFAYRPEVAYLSEMIDTVLQRRLVHPKVADIEESSVVEGFRSGVEYFYTPVSADILDEQLLILDGSNDRLIASDGNIFKAWNLKKSGISQCRDMVVDKLTGWIYVATKKGEVWKIVSLDPLKVELVASGYVLPQLIGVDRIGRIYILDTGRSRVSILDFKGNEKISFLPSDDFTLLLSASKNVESLAVLDAERNRISFFDRWGKVKGNVSLPNGVIAKTIAIDPFGNIFLLDEAGKIHFSSAEAGDEWTLFDYPSTFDGIRVSYPYLLAWSLKGNQVVLFKMVHSSITLNLYIHSISVEPQVNIVFTYSIMTSRGDLVLASSKFTEVYDSGGKIAAELKFKRLSPQIHCVSSDSDFRRLLSELDRGSPSAILLESEKSDLGLETIFPLLLKNVSLFTTCEGIAELARISGGDFVMQDELAELAEYLKRVKKPEMVAVYTISPPLTAGIKSATVLIKIGSFEYSDTIYYLREMLESGTTEESTSVEQSSE